MAGQHTEEESPFNAVSLLKEKKTITELEKKKKEQGTIKVGNRGRRGCISGMEWRIVLGSSIHNFTMRQGNRHRHHGRLTGPGAPSDEQASEGGCSDGHLESAEVWSWSATAHFCFNCAGPSGCLWP